MGYIKKYLRIVKDNLVQFLISILTLLVGIVVANLAGAYVEKFSYSCALHDISHSIFPLIDVNFLTSLLPVLYTFTSILYFFIKDFERLPKLLFLIGLFNFVRGIFLFSTQLPPPYPRIDDYPYITIIGWYFGTKDLFPSGHAGFSFLIFLFVKNSKVYKVISLIMVLLIVTGVLLMRVHYTIDILGAIFIVYALYSFTEKYLSNFFNIKVKSYGPNGSRTRTFTLKE